MSARLRNSAARCPGPTRGLGAALVLVLSTSSCAQSSTDARGSRPRESDRRDSVPKTTRTVERSPLSRTELSTTNGLIATGNLDAQLSGAERLHSRSPDALGACQLVGLHLLRAELFGRPSDLTRAAELGAQAVRLAPEDPRAWRCRADASAALHRFDDALRDLDEAERRAGGKAPPLDGPRAAIDAARGHPQRALARLEGARAEREEVKALGVRAALLGELGEHVKAERLFTHAQYTLRDTSPFPLAWLWFQQGLMWQRAGELERARVLFEAAAERLPGYAPLAGHHAALLVTLHDEAEAIARLRPFVEVEDPEYEGQLAGLLLASADRAVRDEGERLRVHASKRYAALFAQHPEAYADHAARFWLGPGRDVRRALAAAEVNLAVRGTPEAWELALGAAIDAKVWARACTIAAEGKALAKERPDIEARIAPLATLVGERCLGPRGGGLAGAR